MPRVTILYNEPTLPPDHPDADSETDVLETADIISRVLQTAGVPVSRLGVTTDPAMLLAGLKAQSPDVVFNLYEGTASWGDSEAYVAGILELLKVPFTGSSVRPMLVAKSKPVAKQLLLAAGLPTARFVMVESLPVPAVELAWPVIVKPGGEDGSVGIEQKSVVGTRADLEARVVYLLKTYGPPVLIEEFVPGREFHVAVWDRGDGPVALPFTEIVFLEQDGPDPLWPIVSFDAKWKPNSRDFKATPAKNPPDPIDPAAERRVAEVSVRAAAVMGCRDYARVDVRLTPDGRPFILEVNPNPCIHPAGGVSASLPSAKVEYADFILSLVRAALKRGPRPELADAIGSAARPTTAAKSWDVRNDPGGASCLIPGVGLAAAWLTDAEQNVHTLEAIDVRPESRRQGAGRALLKHLEDSLFAAGGRLLKADVTSAPAMSGVRQFLSRCGYLVSGEVIDYFKDGHSRMTYSKALKPFVLPSGVS